MTLARVSMQGNYFIKNGQAFLPIGAHWVPAKTGLNWPLAWDPADLEADFVKMVDLGFNTVRFDLFWAWFEPHPGVYNPSAFQQLDQFINLAHKYEIYLHPALFIGGEVGEAFWDVPWRQGRHPHADPEMLRLQTEHAAEFARRYHSEPAFLAWDLTDEPPFWIVGDRTTDAMAINWTRLIAGALRKGDTNTLLCVGTSMEDVSHGPFRPDNLAAEVDFFSVHPYSIYSAPLFPDPMLSERGTYAGAFESALSAGAGHPVMIHEFGASSAQYDPERIANFDRVTLYSGLAAGACGFLPWCFTDAAPTLYQTVPYLRAPHETQFGLTTWDRQDRPRARVLREFSQLLDKMDFDGLSPAPGEAALIVPHEWAKPHGDMSRSGISDPSLPYSSTQEEAGSGEGNLWLMRSLLSAFILARRAGWKVDMPREYSDWQSHPIVMLPSPLTATEHNLTHIHTTFWNNLRAYVAQGGAVYASLCADAAIPEMEELFGTSLSDHAPAEQIIIKVVENFGSLKIGDEFHYQTDPSNMQNWPATLRVTAGKVIAVDGFDRPALVAHTLGLGKTLVSAYPLENYLAVRPSAFEEEENTHRIYGAFGEWVGMEPLFQTDQPSIEVSGLIGQAGGYAILANHTPDVRTANLSSRLKITAMHLLTQARELPLKGTNETWQVNLDGYSGAILKWDL